MPGPLHSLRILALPVAAVVAGAFAACGTEGQSEFTEAPDAGDSDTSTTPPAIVDASTFTFADVGDGAPSPVATVAFDPPQVTIATDGVTPASTTLTLKATLKDGTVVAVSPQSLQFDRPDLATAQSGLPVSVTAAGAFAGTGKLHGIYGGIEAVADVKVTIARRDVAAGVDPAAVTALDGASLATDPSLTALRYPYDKTVFPLGLTAPLLMWDAPASGDVYKVHLEQAGYTYDAYRVVTSPAQLRIDQAVWDRLTASNGGDPLKLVVSRYASATHVAYSSASETWTIAPASLRGAIYYWTASKLTNNGPQQGHIARIRPGTGAQPEPLSSGQADPCMGCHAVSADGTTLAAAVDTAPTGDHKTYAYTNGWKNGRAWASFDLPSGTVRKQTTYYGGNLALTPDGAYTVFGGRAKTDTGPIQAGSKYLSLADTKTGTIVTTSGLDGIQLADAAYGVMMPAFSPDGTSLAVVEAAGDLRDNVIPDSKQILLFAFNRAALTFAATPTRLPLATFSPYTASGIGYPSFTPDTKYVAFHVGNQSTGCFKDAFGNCDDGAQHRGSLWLQGTDGTSTPVRMDAANDPPAATDREQSVEPTFNPIQRGGYSWVVFTSMRDWGNKLTGTANNGKRRLWVAAVDATPGASDASHPAFYLEGQEDSPNMRGFWTLAQCTPTPGSVSSGADAGASDASAGDAGASDGGASGTCSAGFECCSGFCDKGVCVDVSTVACRGLGESCQTSADCCNPASVSCVGGVCTANVPK